MARTKKDLMVEIERLTAENAALTVEVEKLEKRIDTLEDAADLHEDDPSAIAAAMVRGTTSGDISWLSHEERQQWIERAEAAITAMRSIDVDAGNLFRVKGV